MRDSLLLSLLSCLSSFATYSDRLGNDSGYISILKAFLFSLRAYLKGINQKPNKIHDLSSLGGFFRNHPDVQRYVLQSYLDHSEPEKKSRQVIGCLLDLLEIDRRAYLGIQVGR